MFLTVLLILVVMGSFLGSTSHAATAKEIDVSVSEKDRLNLVMDRH